MVFDNNVPLPPPPRVLGSGDVPRRSGQPGVYGPTDENLSRMNDEGCPNDSQSGTMLPAIRNRKKTHEGTQAVKMRSTVVKAGIQWRLWLGLGLCALAILIAALSTPRTVMLMFLALSALVVLVGLVQLSLWSKLRRSWL
jgi:hypothetical protein